MSNDLMEKDALAIMKAEIDMAVATAKMYPRDLKKFLNEATQMATFNEEIAESCIYSLPRKKKNEKTGQYEQTYIKGKSIRLAEILKNSYMNIYCQARIKSFDSKTVKVEGVAWDLEKNDKVSQELVENVNGTHSDAIKLATAAASSKVLRNVILRVVPGAYADIVYKAALTYAIGDQKTFSTKRVAVFDRFKKLGINQEIIFKFFNKESIEEFNEEDMEILIGIGTAIKQGDIKIDEAFAITTANSEMDAKERIDFLLASKGVNHE